MAEACLASAMPCIQAPLLKLFQEKLLTEGISAAVNYLHAESDHWAPMEGVDPDTISNSANSTSYSITAFTPRKPPSAPPASTAASPTSLLAESLRRRLSGTGNALA